MVAKRLDGSGTGRLYMLQRLRRDVACRSLRATLGGLAHHVELAPKYQAEDYIQHNPNIATGRAAGWNYVPREAAVAEAVGE